jgi:hypothetical protein
VIKHCSKHRLLFGLKISEEEYKDDASSYSSTFSRINPNIWNINKI